MVLVSIPNPNGLQGPLGEQVIVDEEAVKDNVVDTKKALFYWYVDPVTQQVELYPPNRTVRTVSLALWTEAMAFLEKKFGRGRIHPHYQEAGYH